MKPVEDFKLDVFIPAINAICTKHLAPEEKNLLEKIKIIFSKSWDKISMWERLMTDYIMFCQTKEELNPESFEATNRQFR